MCKLSLIEVGDNTIARWRRDRIPTGDRGDRISRVRSKPNADYWHRWLKDSIANHRIDMHNNTASRLEGLSNVGSAGKVIKRKVKGVWNKGASMIKSNRSLGESTDQVFANLMEGVLPEGRAGVTPAMIAAATKGKALLQAIKASKAYRKKHPLGGQYRKDGSRNAKPQRQGRRNNPNPQYKYTDCKGEGRGRTGESGNAQPQGRGRRNSPNPQYLYADCKGDERGRNGR